MVLPATEGHEGGVAALIGLRPTLAAQPIGCLRRLAATVGRGHLGLAAEGTSGMLGLDQPNFEELVAKPAPAVGGRLRGGEHLVWRHVRRRTAVLRRSWGAASIDTMSATILVHYVVLPPL